MQKTLLALLFLVSFKAQAISVSVKEISGEGPVNYIVPYRVDHYFRVTMKDVREALNLFIKNSDSAAKALNKLISQYKQGDRESRRLLLYLFFDKKMAEEFPFVYTPHFTHILWDQEIQDETQSLLYNQRRNYEPYIEALKKLIIASWMKINSPQVYELLESSFLALHKVGSRKVKDLDYLWAFINLDLYYSGSQVEEENVKQAKIVLLKLAEEDYAPAQYFQAFINIKEDNNEEALFWLEKSFPALAQEGNLILLYALYKYYKKDNLRAKNFLKKAYKQGVDTAGPALMDIYLKEKEDDLALKLAEEIIKDYEKHHFKFAALAFNVILSILSKNPDKNVDSVLLWHFKFQIFSQRKGIALSGHEALISEVKKQATAEQIRQAERIAKEEMSFFAPTQKRSRCRKRMLH